MVKRLLALLVLLTCAAPADAQFRIRKRAAGTPPANGKPTVVISVPTSQSTFYTTATSIEVRGTAADDGAVAAVRWALDTGGSGDASFDGSAWSIAAGSGGAATIFQDSFTSATTVDLITHTPNTGTSWAEAVDSLGTETIRVRGSFNYIEPLAFVSNQRLIYLATPSPALSGSNYDLSFKIAGAGGANEDSALIFGYADSANYCGVKVYNASYTPDVVLFKRVADVVTTLDSKNVGPVVGDTVSVEVRGTSLTVKIGTTSVATATDTFCDDNIGVGVGFGTVAGGSTDEISTSNRVDDFTVVNHGAAGSGITLALGANVLTITATDNLGLEGTTTITITRTATDQIDPVPTITGPVSTDAYVTATAPITISGRCTDNVGCTGVSLACSGCTPTTASCTLSGANPLDKTFTCDPVDLASGANNVIVTAVDAAANDLSDTLIATRSASADTTNPDDCTITTNGGSNFTATSSPSPILGTAHDNVGVTSVTCNCPTCSPANITAFGTDNWSATYGWGNGANVVTCVAHDQAGNVSDPDSITVTFSQPLAITPDSMPGATVGTAYVLPNGYLMVAAGGTLPYTWSKVDAGTTLNDSDPQCAGLVISVSGLVTGTATTTGTCTWTAKVTDAVSTVITKTLTIEVSVAPTGQHAYFTELLARGDFWKAISLRPNPAKSCTSDGFTSGTVANGTCNPYYSTQLTGLKDVDGMRNGRTLENPQTQWADYNYAADTDPHRQDAMKIIIPPFAQKNGAVLAASITNGTDTIITVTTTGMVNWANLTTNQGFRVDNEIMVCSTATDVNPVAAGSQCFYNNGAVITLNVSRGQFGTTAVSHTVGTDFRVVVNGFTTSQQLRYSFNTVEGYTYLFTYDMYWTDSYLGIYAGGYEANKFFQFGVHDAYWLETQTGWAGGNTSSGGKCSGWDAGGGKSTYVMGYWIRLYNILPPGGTWIDTDGRHVGDNVTDNDLLKPMGPSVAPDTGFCVLPNTWTRVWFVVKQQANDYDLFSMWIGDETRDAVQLFGAAALGGPLKISVTDPTGAYQTSISNWWIEGNSTNINHALGSVNPFRDRVLYLRNFAILRWVNGSAPDIPTSGLLVRPR